jgi:dihydroxyacetone kinase-like protein
MTLTREHILAWLRAFGAVISENKAYLTTLDSAIGDADHGVNMDRGMTAVLNKLDTLTDKDIGTIFKTVAMTLISSVGGASGPLYGTLFLQMATAGGDKTELTLAEWIAAFDAGLNGLIARGKTQAGDKTMVDALLPAINALREAAANGDTLKMALLASAAAAAKGRDATKPLLAKKGRASYLGERSIGHQDPGATSAHLLLKTLAELPSLTD